MLSVEKGHGHYGELTVLHDIHLSVARGSIVSVVGTNGAGKSSLIKSLMGVEIETEGRIQLQGEEISRWPTHKRVAAGMVMVPEGRRLFPEMSVRENLELGAYMPRARKRRQQGFDFVYSLLPKLKEREKQPAGSLSGGEQQMVALGRALMAQPQVLLLDEPFLGLAPIMVCQVTRFLQELKEQGLIILMVEQNATSSLRCSDWGYVLVSGRVVSDGQGEGLLQSQDLREVYLGV